MTLGAASFEFVAHNADLIAKAAQAEAAAKKAYAEIAKASDVSAAAVERASKQMAAAYVRQADAGAAATLKTIRSFNDQADAADKAAQKMAASQKSGASEMLGFAKAGAGFVAAAAGITTGAAAIHAAMAKVADETQKAAQAQFALNELYGKTSPLVTKQADDLAKLAGQSRTSAKEAAASVATLARNYALTGAQIESVLKISADLAAVRGISLAQASERVEGALRGEAEAIEYLGQALNSDAVKALAAMTDEQRKHFETLSPITKAQIVLNALVKNTADLQGAAARRTQDAAGANTNLQAATDNLAESLGKRLAPATVSVTNALADFLKKQDEIVRDDRALNYWKAYYETLFRIATLDFTEAQRSAARIVNAQRELQGLPSDIQVGPDPGLPGAGPGPTQAQLQAIKDADAARRQYEADQKDRVRSYTEFVTKQVDKEADAREEAARRAAKAEDERIERARIGLEVEKAAREKSLEERHRATIKGIGAEEAAAEAASKATIERLEIEKQATLDAAEAAKDRALGAIKAKKEALDQERELEDRARDDRRQQEDRELADARAREDRETEIRQRGIAARREAEDRDREDRRRADDQDLQQRRQKADQERAAARQKEDRDLEDAAQRSARRREQEDRDRHDLRTAEDAQVADRRKDQDAQLAAAQKSELDALEATHSARLKAIADEIQAVGDRKDATLRALDAEADRLRDDAEKASRLRAAAHEQTLRRLDAEAEAARDAAERDSRARATVHETALRLIEGEAEAHRRAADVVLKGIDDAARAEDDRHRSAVQAIDDEKRRRQDAVDAQIAALDALDRADSRAAEDQRLGDAVTNARFGVKKAESTGNQSEIVKAQQELDNALRAISQTRLERERDAARDVLKARKDAIADEAEAARRAEDERNRQLDRALQAAREQERALLQSVLDRLAAQKQAEDDRYSQEQRSSSDALDLILADIERRKVAEQDSYAAAKLAAQDALDAQLAAIAKRKTAVGDEAEAALRRLRERQEAEKAAYDRDVERINARYQSLKDALAAERLDEDRHREARRLGEDRDLADHRKKEDDRLTEDKKRIADRRTAEDQALDAARTREDTQRANRRTAEDRDRTDRRTAEDQQFKEAGERLSVLRLHEDRDRQDRRQAEDHQRTDFRREEDLRLSAQQAAVEKQYDDERRATAAHFDGPNGVITQVRAAMERAKTEYRLRKEHAEEQFSAERAALGLVYRSPDKKGLLDLQDEAAKNNHDRLADQVKDIEQWKKDANTWIDENKGKWKDLEGAIRSVSGAITGLPNGGRPPAGAGGTGGPNSYGNEATGQRYRLPSGQEVELGSVGGSVAPNQQIPNPPSDEVERFIRQVAPQYGIPAEDAVRVWSGEGRSAYVGDSGTSFGPYQLHVGGGLGNDFAQTYKLDPRDPATWREQVMYTMAYVQVHGWNGQWHGAPPDLMNKRYADGGWVDRASWLVDQETGRRWGSIAEGGRRELVVPEHRVPAMYAGADTAALARGSFVEPLMAGLAAMTSSPGLPALTGALPALAASASASQDGGPRTMHVPVFLGRHLITDLWIDGQRGAVDTGRHSDRSPKGRAKTGGQSW